MAKSGKLRIPTILAWIVMLATIGLGLTFFIRAGLFAALVKPDTKPAKTVSSPKLIKTGKSTINGFDSDGQPYRLTAQSTLQDADNQDIVNMKFVTGILTQNDGKQLTAKALEGRYDTVAKRLQLTNQVQLAKKGDYTAIMDKAMVFLDEKRLRSDVPVFVTFDRGTISANGMEITENGKRILFFNRVKAKFRPKSTADESKQNRQE